MGDSNPLRYLFSHKHKKCTQAVFSSLLKISVANAWLLYKEHSMRDVSQLDFLENLVIQMSGYNNLSKCHLGNSHSNRMHLILRTKTHRNCIYCLTKKKKHNNTPYICNSCNVYLHPDCFFAYHSQ